MPGRAGRISVCVGKPVGEVVAALRNHREGFEPTTDLVPAHGAVQIAGERHDPRRHGCRGDGVQGVQQRRGGDLRRGPVAN